MLAYFYQTSSSAILLQCSGLHPYLLIYGSIDRLNSHLKKSLLSKLKKSLEALVEMNDGFIEGSWSLHTGNTARQKPGSVSEKKEKLEVIIVKSAFLKIISPAFLALGLVRNCYQSEVRHTG